MPMHDVTCERNVPVRLKDGARTSSGPRSGNGVIWDSGLKLSAALANARSGAVIARAAHTPSMIVMMAIESAVMTMALPAGGAGIITNPAPLAAGS